MFQCFSWRGGAFLQKCKDGEMFPIVMDVFKGHGQWWKNVCHKQDAHETNAVQFVVSVLRCMPKTQTKSLGTVGTNEHDESLLIAFLWLGSVERQRFKSEVEFEKMAQEKDKLW